MFKKNLFMVLLTLLAFSIATADELEMEPGYKVPDIPTIKVTGDSGLVEISLAGLLEYHGDPCPGACFAFRALREALGILWGDEAPARNDIAVFCRGPMYGVLDAITLTVYGDMKTKVDAVTSASPGPSIPKGMKPSRDKFHITMIRKSTGDAVDMIARKDLYRSDFFKLRQKVKAEKATSEETERLNGYKRVLVRKIPVAKAGELFEAPKKYQVIMWGI